MKRNPVGAALVCKLGKGAVKGLAWKSRKRSGGQTPLAGS